MTQKTKLALHLILNFFLHVVSAENTDDNKVVCTYIEYVQVVLVHFRHLGGKCLTAVDVKIPRKSLKI